MSTVAEGTALADYLSWLTSERGRTFPDYESLWRWSIEDLDGFCSASLLIDRASGRGVSSVTFDSLDAMERNRDQATALKIASIREAGVEAVDDSRG